MPHRSGGIPGCRDPLIYYTNALLVFVRWSLQFENNSDSHVIAAPTDAFWKRERWLLSIHHSLARHGHYKLGGATVQVICGNWHSHSTTLMGIVSAALVDVVAIVLLCCVTPLRVLMQYDQIQPKLIHPNHSASKFFRDNWQPEERGPKGGFVE